MIINKKLQNRNKKLKVEATIVNRANDDDEIYDEIHFEIQIPSDEWVRLKEEGMFSFNFQNVMDGYKKWLEEITRFEVVMKLVEVKDGRIES